MNALRLNQGIASVILAAGKGSRLRETTGIDIPKWRHKINERSLLSIQREYIRKNFDVAKEVIVLSEESKRFSVSVDTSKNTRILYIPTISSGYSLTAGILNTIDYRMPILISLVDHVFLSPSTINLQYSCIPAFEDDSEDSFFCDRSGFLLPYHKENCILVHDCGLFYFTHDDAEKVVKNNNPYLELVPLLKNAMLTQDLEVRRCAQVGFVNINTKTDLERIT